MRMRAQQHCVQTGKRRAHAHAQNQRERNGGGFTGVFFYPIFCFHYSGGRGSGGSCSMHAFARHLRRSCGVTNCVIEDLLCLFAGGSGSVTNDLAGIACRIANNFASIFGSALCFVRGASGGFAHLVFFGESFRFRAQMLSAVGDRLRAATGSITGYPRPISDDSFHAQFFIQFLGFAFCCPMKVVKFFFVIGHRFFELPGYSTSGRGVGFRN